MNRKQMEYFLEVYRSGHIQAAADRLYVSRQGVSKMLRALEEELGQLLFVRSSHGLVPTDYATALLPHVRRLLEEYTTIESMNTLAAQSKSVVTVFALDHVFAYLGAKFFTDFHAAHPEIVLSTVDTTDEAALEGLQAGRCGFAIVTGPLDPVRFDGDELFYSHYCVRLHKDHPLAGLSRVNYSDLDGQSVVSKGRAYQCFRYNIDKYILLQGYRVDILAETADEKIICELLLHHGAINLGYDYASALYPHPELVTRPLGPEAEDGQQVYLVRDKMAALTEAGKKFRRFLLDWLPENGKDKVTG